MKINRQTRGFGCITARDDIFAVANTISDSPLASIATFIIGSGSYLHRIPDEVVYLLPGEARSVPEYFTSLSGVFFQHARFKLINIRNASARNLAVCPFVDGGVSCGNALIFYIEVFCSRSWKFQRGNFLLDFVLVCL